MRFGGLRDGANSVCRELPCGRDVLRAGEGIRGLWVRGDCVVDRPGEGRRDVGFVLVVRFVVGLRLGVLLLIELLVSAKLYIFAGSANAIRLHSTELFAPPGHPFTHSGHVEE